MTKYRIPVRVVAPPVTPRQTRPSEPALPKIAPKEPPAAAPLPANDQVEEAAYRAASSADAVPAEAEVSAVTDTGTYKTTETKEREHVFRSSEDQEWRERALRLEAEMANYRRRQQRIAQEEARSGQIALLKDVLVIADNLDRALAASHGHASNQSGPDSLTQGVQLTRSALQQILAKHGLERMQVKGMPFDPAWHEAMHVVPAETFGATPGTVVEVLEAGYRRQDALFRPAKVVVAQ